MTDSAEWLSSISAASLTLGGKLQTIQLLLHPGCLSEAHDSFSLKLKQLL